MPEAETFLVVDDNRVERDIMARTLRSAFPRSRVLEAGDVESAERMCRKRSYDCIVLDYNMPDMDGLSFAQKIKSSYPYMALVLVTSVGDEMLAARALRSGLSDYIPKSRINTESIRRTVARAVHISMQSRVIDEQRAELENFAYALAHDFKQPIRQIRTFTQLIGEEIERADKEGVQKHLDFLCEAARRLGNLVDVMSQYTLLNKPPEIETVDLGKVVETISVSIAPYLEERGGQIIAHPLPRVSGNETLMIQTLQNLIVNGLQYNKSEAPTVEIDAVEQEDGFLVKVTDNGIGMEARYFSDIFKPLLRLHTAAEYSGTGLGLTLARKAVTAQGGRIWCESEVGTGSTFFLDLRAPGESGASLGESRAAGV